MAFQFQCPQCVNLLEAEESQAGQQCNCPFCSTLFFIPSPIAPAPGPAAPSPEPPAPAPASPAPQAPFPGIDLGGPGGPAPAPQPSDPVALESKEPELLHIPCPDCQEMLETPVEMLDQDVMCPHCQAQFQLRRQNSLEYKKKQQQQREMREHKASKAWFNWAIVVAVLVVMFLLFLIFSSQSE